MCTWVQFLANFQLLDMKLFVKVVFFLNIHYLIFTGQQPCLSRAESIYHIYTHREKNMATTAYQCFQHVDFWEKRLLFKKVGLMKFLVHFSNCLSGTFFLLLFSTINHFCSFILWPGLIILVGTVTSPWLLGVQLPKSIIAPRMFLIYPVFIQVSAT